MDGGDEERLRAGWANSGGQDLVSGANGGVAATWLESAGAARQDTAAVVANDGGGDGAGLSSRADGGGEADDLGDDGGAIVTLERAVGDGGCARGDGLGGSDVDSQGGHGLLSGIGGGVVSTAEVLVELAGVVV